LYHNDTLIDARPIEVPAGGTHGEAFDNFPYDAGVVQARLDLQDDLAADNRAWAYLVPRADLNVQLVGKESPFLQRALQIDPRVKVTQVPTAEYKPGGDADVTVLNGWAPPHLDDGSYLLINAGAPEAPVEVTGRVSVPAVVRWAARHPVMRYVDFEEVAVAEALSVALRPWGQSLVDADTTPLLVAGRRGNVRAVYIGFALERSNLPLRAAFPILMQNCLEWLATGQDTMANRSVRTGDAAPLPPPGPQGTLTVRGPDGSETEVRALRGAVAFDATETAGVYRVSNGEGQFLFVANLLSADESNLRPRREIAIGGQRVGSGSAVVTSNREIWRYLAVIALVILAVEWYVYHRRI
jgi:hypothetical protein